LIPTDKPDFTPAEKRQDVRVAARHRRQLHQRGWAAQHAQLTRAKRPDLVLHFRLKSASVFGSGSRAKLPR